MDKILDSKDFTDLGVLNSIPSTAVLSPVIVFGEKNTDDILVATSTTKPYGQHPHEIDEYGMPMSAMVMPVDNEFPLTKPRKQSMSWEEEEPVNENSKYSEKSCFCLTQDHLIRKICLEIYANPWFDRTSMAFIGANCVTLAMFNPLDPDCLTKVCQDLDIAGLLFSAFFFFEMCVKIIAMGFYDGEAAYIRDSWNKLDFFVVMISIPDFFPFLNAGPLKMLRIMRALRPLRMVNKIPALKVLIGVIMKCLPNLGNVVALMCLELVIFSILGGMLFSGLYSQRCQNPTTGDVWEPGDFGSPFYCAAPPSIGFMQCSENFGAPMYYVTPESNTTNETANSTNSTNDANGSRRTTLYVTPDYRRKGGGGGGGGAGDTGYIDETSVPMYSTNFTDCVPSLGPNPNHGLHSYDNFASAFIMCFIVGSGDGAIFNFIVYAPDSSKTLLMCTFCLTSGATNMST